MELRRVDAALAGRGAAIARAWAGVTLGRDGGAQGREQLWRIEIGKKKVA